MLAFFGNLAPLEFLVIVIVAILVFGRDLPTVALRGFAQLRKLRRSLEDLRRETGIDRELRNIERSMQEAAYQATRERKLAAPAEPRIEHGADDPVAAPEERESLEIVTDPDSDRGPEGEERRGIDSPPL